MTLHRAFGLIAVFVIFTGCDGSPTAPQDPASDGTSPPTQATPANISATLTILDANTTPLVASSTSAIRNVIPGPTQLLMRAVGRIAWSNTGGTGARLFDPELEFQHEGGRIFTQPVDLGLDNLVPAFGVRSEDFIYYWSNEDAATAMGPIVNLGLRYDHQEEGSSTRVAGTAGPVDVDGSLLGRDTRGCVENPFTLCVVNARFAVEVNWLDGDSSGRATVTASTVNTGTFRFSESGSDDLSVELLDRCSTNSHFWVFVSATTGVEFTMTVTDTQTGTARDYTNPFPGVVPPAITDTEAFATCP